MGFKKGKRLSPVRRGRASYWRICPSGNHLWHLDGAVRASRKLAEDSIVRVKVEHCKWHSGTEKAAELQERER